MCGGSACTVTASFGKAFFVYLQHALLYHLLDERCARSDSILRPIRMFAT